MKQSMEHRWNFRKPVEAEVILHYSRLGVVWAKMRNVGYGGMCLETRPLTLYPNSKVHVTFLVRRGAEVVHRSVEALVIYMNGHGCGLMFSDFDRHTFRFLHTLIHAEA